MPRFCVNSDRAWIMRRDFEQNGTPEFSTSSSTPPPAPPSSRGLPPPDRRASLELR